MHTDLGTMARAVRGGPVRTFVVAGGDNSTRVTFFVADGPDAAAGVALIDGRDARNNTLVLWEGQQATFRSGAVFIGYSYTGTPPGAVWVDAPEICPAPGALAAAVLDAPIDTYATRVLEQDSVRQADMASLALQVRAGERAPTADRRGYTFELRGIR